MFFAVFWTFSPESTQEVNTRFKETGGAPPREVKMLGRWHSLGEGEGVLICETDNPVALGKWVQEWSDLMTFRVMPVVDDAGASEMIS